MPSILADQQCRRDTEANWASVNPALPAGMWGFETDTGRAKLGDGVSTWNQLRHHGVHTHARLAYTVNQALNQTVSEAQLFANNFVSIEAQTTTGIVWTLASPTTTASLHRVVVVEVGGTSTAPVTVAGAAGDRVFLAPGQSVAMGWNGVAWRVVGDVRPAWHGVIYGAYGDCDPNDMFDRVQNNGTTGVSPNNVSQTVARLAYFRPPTTLAMQRIRFYGLGAVTNGFRVAIYLASTNAQVVGPVTLTTAANAWGSAVMTGTLLGGTAYYLAVTATLTSPTTALATMSPTPGVGTGVLGGAVPTARPGSLSVTGGYSSAGFAQATVAAGALGATLAPAVQAAWTGGFPAFWLDSNPA